MAERKAEKIAAAFLREWESAWNLHGGAAAARLYTPGSVLAGQAIGVGRPQIERMLDTLFKQGWTRIAIKLVNAREVSGAVLTVAEFTATGSGANAGKTLNGKSTHVLVRAGETWLSAMHTAV